MDPSFVNVTLQFFDTIDSAYNYAEEELENATILIHSGVYQREFLVIDSNVTMIGAGQFTRYVVSPTTKILTRTRPCTAGIFTCRWHGPRR